MSEKLPTKCRTPEFLVSYPAVFEARAVEPGQDPKYSISMLFDRSSVDLTEMQEKAWNAAINKFGMEKAQQLQEAGMLRSPFRDGTLDKPNDTNYDGKTFCNARSKDKPEVVEIAGNKVVPIVEPVNFYAGCIAVATVTFFGYDTAGNRGVAIGLDNVCKIEDGERIGGGRRPAKDDFAEFAAARAKRKQAKDGGAQQFMQ
jgi:hypothetical protein